MSDSVSGHAPQAPAAPVAPTPADLRAPSLARRMAAFSYEGVLLFGVWMAAAALYSVATDMRHALHGRLGLMAFLLATTALYFVWFWSHGGQTLAMKTWHIRLVDARGLAVSWKRALVRYLLAWLWLAPALLAAHYSSLKVGPSTLVIVLAGITVYAVLSRFSPQRQFWHDVVCGTRLVDARPTGKPTA